VHRPPAVRCDTEGSDAGSLRGSVEGNPHWWLDRSPEQAARRQPIVGRVLHKKSRKASTVKASPSRLVQKIRHDSSPTLLSTPGSAKHSPAQSSIQPSRLSRPSSQLTSSPSTSLSKSSPRVSPWHSFTQGTGRARSTHVYGASSASRRSSSPSEQTCSPLRFPDHGRARARNKMLRRIVFRLATPIALALSRRNTTRVHSGLKTPIRQKTPQSDDEDALHLTAKCDMTAVEHITPPQSPSSRRCTPASSSRKENRSMAAEAAILDKFQTPSSHEVLDACCDEGISRSLDGGIKFIKADGIDNLAVVVGSRRSCHPAAARQLFT